jgi:hypothetical protein
MDNTKQFDTICMWCDLLGYGSAFYNSNWDLTTDESKKIFNELRILKVN